MARCARRASTARPSRALITAPPATRSAPSTNDCAGERDERRSRPRAIHRPIQTVGWTDVDGSPRPMSAASDAVAEPRIDSDTPIRSF